MFLPHSSLDGYKTTGLVKEVLLTVQRSTTHFPFLTPYAHFPRHQSQDRQIPSVYIPFFSNKHHDLQHNERPTRYPLEVFDRCPLGHHDIRLVIESSKPDEVLTFASPFSSTLSKCRAVAGHRSQSRVHRRLQRLQQSGTSSHLESCVWRSLPVS